MQSDTREEGAHTYLGAYALCLDNVNRLLLCRLNMGCTEAGYWTLPGGGLDWGEPPEDAVVRELREETGLRPGEISLVGPIYSEVYPNKTQDRPGDPVHHVGLIYRVRELAGMLRSETAGSTDLCAWFTSEEAEQLPLTSLGRFALGIAWPKKDEAGPTGGSESWGGQASPSPAHPSPRSE